MYLKKCSSKRPSVPGSWHRVQDGAVLQVVNTKAEPWKACIDRENERQHAEDYDDNKNCVREGNNLWSQYTVYTAQL